MNIDVRTKDPCRFCSERNKQCGGACSSEQSEVEKLNQQLKIAEKELELKEQMIDYILTADILGNQSFSSESDFNTEFCKQYEQIKQQALAEIKEAGE